MRWSVPAAVIAALPCAASASPSLECSYETSAQVETSQCLAGVEEAVNFALDVALKYARQSAEELDSITERSSAVPALDAAQSAWEDYRNAQCDYAGALFAGGSGTGIEIRSCRIELTRERIRALEAKTR